MSDCRCRSTHHQNSLKKFGALPTFGELCPALRPAPVCFPGQTDRNICTKQMYWIFICRPRKNNTKIGSVGKFELEGLWVLNYNAYNTIQFTTHVAVIVGLLWFPIISRPTDERRRRFLSGRSLPKCDTNVRDRLPFLCKISAKSVQQFQRRCDSNRQTSWGR